jgi:PKD repeat protein
MIVSVTNSGSSDAYNVTGLLSGTDPYVTVSTTQPQSYGNLSPEVMAEASFTVSAAANTPFGYTAQLTIDLSADMGITQQDVIEIVFSDYCEATTQVEDEYISNVVCGDISNSSGWQGSVANYTDMSTTLQPGVPVPITVTNGNAWAADIVYVWVDWNLNKDFGNTNETFQLTNVGGSGQTFTGNITAPAGQNPGNFRMRVRMTYSTAPEPCGDATYGEIEDYTVIVAGVTANFSANVTAGCEGMEVQFTDNSIGATSWLWTFEGGTPAISTEQNPVVTYAAFGQYDVTLEVSNGTNSTSLTKTNYIDVMTVPGQAGPINGASTVNIGDIEEYSTPALDECTLYNWVLTPAEAGVMVCEMNVATISWSETYTGSATLKVCGGNDCGMGLYSEEFQVVVYDPTGINETGGIATGIYPNPNNGQFVLKLNSSKATSYEVIIVNMLGMDIYNNKVEVNGNYTENINIASMAEGVYYLYLKNAENTTVKKIVIQK